MTPELGIAQAVRICSAVMPGLLGGTCSLRLASDDTIVYLNDERVAGACMTERDVISRDLRTSAGDSEVTGALSIMDEMYRRRPSLRAIVHWHPMNVMTLASIGQRLKPLILTGAFLPEAGIEPLALADAHGSDAPLCITTRLGAFSYGASIEEAVTVMCGAEKNAEQQVRAAAVGTPTFFRGGEYGALFSEQQGYAAHGVHKYWSYLFESAQRTGALSGLGLPVSV